MSKIVTYEELEKRYPKNNTARKDIENRTVGCSNCVGYCMYEEHEGYLTEALRRKHDCLNKQCTHYIAKPAKKKVHNYSNAFATVFSNMQEAKEKILELACNLTKSFEAMKFISSNVSVLGRCELSYITISNDYSFDDMINEIEEQTGYKVSLKRLNYSFDNACKLIMEK